MREEVGDRSNLTHISLKTTNSLPPTGLTFGGHRDHPQLHVDPAGLVPARELQGDRGPRTVEGEAAAAAAREA